MGHSSLFNEEIFCQLIKLNCDVTAVDDESNNVLHLAADQNKEVIKIMKSNVNFQSLINKENSQNCFPWEMAFESNCFETFRVCKEQNFVEMQLVMNISKKYSYRPANTKEQKSLNSCGKKSTLVTLISRNLKRSFSIVKSKY